jgi:uncharacterized protein (DUF433 family)
MYRNRVMSGSTNPPLTERTWIVTTADTCWGQTRIRGTRLPIQMLRQAARDGVGYDEARLHWPTLPCREAWDAALAHPRDQDETP